MPASVSPIPSPSLALAVSTSHQGISRPVLCLHSSSGTHAQWRAVAERLAPRHQLLMPDLLGHGRSPAWPERAPDDLRVDAEAALACAEGVREPLDLVAHSYGAALALQIAIDHPERVRSLTLYEPVAFGLLCRHEPWGAAWAEIRAVAQGLSGAVAMAQNEAAAQHFTNYWSAGQGWAGLNEHQQAAIAARMPTVHRHFEALFAADWGPTELRELRMPVHLICGSMTRLPPLRIAQLLSRWLPRARLHRLEGAGHLGPIQRAGEVADLMADLVSARPRAIAEAA